MVMYSHSPSDLSIKSENVDCFFKARETEILLVNIDDLVMPIRKDKVDVKTYEKWEEDEDITLEEVSTQQVVDRLRGEA